MRRICIVAGGTGGHINAALAMSQVFSPEFDIIFLTGTRYLDYQLFKNQKVLHLDSRALRTKNILKLALSFLFNIYIFIKILFVYLKKRPCFILGAGGYVCGPTLLAGKILGIPIFIIEQNAVLGLTNKILSNFSNLVFTNFLTTKGLKQSSHVIRSGNPIRSNIVHSPNTINERINILVFGGSLGARQINEAIEVFVRKDFFCELSIIHQVGKDYFEPSFEGTSRLSYKQVEYIDDMEEKYRWANIIICRAGASTISELRILRRPAIIIPYALASDNHQYYNAQQLQNENSFHVDIMEHQLSGKELGERISISLSDIIRNQKFGAKEGISENAADLIKKEIIKNVWS